MVRIRRTRCILLHDRQQQLKAKHVRSTQKLGNPLYLCFSSKVLCLCGPVAFSLEAYWQTVLCSTASEDTLLLIAPESRWLSCAHAKASQLPSKPPSPQFHLLFAACTLQLYVYSVRQLHLLDCLQLGSHCLPYLWTPGSR